MVSKLVNDPHDVVQESLEGLVLLQPGLRLLEDRTTVVRVDRLAHGPSDPAVPVAVISGGGAGHEPSDGGFVGAGMLTAAVTGGVFSSPGPDAVHAAIRAVSGAAGCLLVVKNYTGDRLNFQLGAELAIAEGYRVETVLVNDDVSLAESEDNAGRRGLAGTVLVEKVAGALAEQGRPLEEVRDAASAVVGRIGTMNLGLSALTVPGASAPSFELGEDEAELGLGIHGEPGVRRIRKAPADKLVHILISRIATEHGIRAGASVVALVGGSGATPQMELAIAARAVARELALRRIRLVRLYAGEVMTSLDMAGVSVTLLPLDDADGDSVVEALDAPTAVLAWPGRGVAGPPELATVEGPPHEIGEDAPGEPDPHVRAAIDAACQALLDSETELTRLDRQVGDGDLGQALARGAYGWLADPAEGDAGYLLRHLSEVVRREVGGSSGALYAMGLLRASEAIADGGGWGDALTAAVDGIATLGAAEPGDGTMVDALAPAMEAWPQGPEAVVAAARSGADSTVEGVSRRGRASYLGARGQGYPDPGAVAVVRWMEAVYDLEAAHDQHA
ncbi:homodimeric dihydroxyacetone kinase [Raineyella antarctica]|uniref:Homodimeric dihydroxyacetone kinase n=1 Tax=Raineyella antarctica TaxID=1577474 RepID=A0A1G6GG28_9ACTN|nr:dihydroxyacetone kinase family protein [Raineyella antarctica]SDB80947.1 homodimeric dihydroxyacetone kinase [Raineyella antarctica]